MRSVSHLKGKLLDHKLTKMITRARISRFLLIACDLVAGFDKVMFDRQEGVVERRSARSRRAVVVSHKWHRGTINHMVWNRLESLMFSHVLVHILGIPRWIFGDNSPIIVVLARSSNV